MKIKKIYAAFCLFACGLFTPVLGVSGTALSPSGAVYGLSTEMEETPLGLDGGTARVSWKLALRKDARSGEFARGQRQTAYRLRVAESEAALKANASVLWDSGKIASDAQVLVPLAMGLKPATRYFWTVRVWDERGADLGESAPTWFETGLFGPKDWEPARWMQSPVLPANDSRFDQWLKFAIFPLKANVDANKWNVTPEDLKSSEEKFYNEAKRTIWSASLFRREFSVRGPVARARLYISGLGYYRAYLNGGKIGDRDLAPSDSHFSVKANYNVFDITKGLAQGRNALAVEVVNGRWRAWLGNTPEQYSGRPVLIAKLVVDYANGGSEVVATDSSWSCGRGGIEREGFWNGELFDANTYPEGWMKPGFAAAGWQPAKPAKPKEPIGELRRDIMPPERIIERGHPVVRTEPMPKVWVYDFGRQLGGRARFHFSHLKKGQAVVVRYAETVTEQARNVASFLAYYDSFNNERQRPGMLRFKRRGCTGARTSVAVTQPDGTKITKNIEGGISYCDMFISAGKPEEVWEPSFTYTGFRYLEILGLERPLELSQIDGFDLHTVPKSAGLMTTDNSKLNRVLEAVKDTLLLCFHSQFQDNNGAERNSNLTNIGLNDLNAAYTWDAYPLWLKGLDDNVRMNRYIDWPANLVTGLRNTNNPKGKRYLLLADCYHYGQTPWNMVAFYGDRKPVDPFIPWQLKFIREAAEYTIWHDITTYGDHISESSLANLPNLRAKGQHLPSEFVQTGMVLQNADLMIDLYKKLGLETDAATVGKIRKACLDEARKRFYDEAKGQWVPGMISRQQIDVVLGQMNLTPRPAKAELAQDAVDDMKLRTHGHLITGSRLSDPLLHLLSRNGQADAACGILLREDYPSILRMLKTTGDSIQESWGDGDSFAQIEGITAMGNWFFRDLVGIAPDPAYPAFHRFTLSPVLPSQVGAFDFDYESVRGQIGSHLKKQGQVARWTVTVPPNTTAIVDIPTADPGSVTESGAPWRGQLGIRPVSEQERGLSLELKSGVYVFDFAMAGGRGNSRAH